jgi:hypothetical protein
MDSRDHRACGADGPRPNGVAARRDEMQKYPPESDGVRLRRWSSEPIPLALAIIALSFIALQVGCGLANGEGLRWDFANFYDAGHKAAAGETGSLYDPTATIDGAPALGHMTFLGTPLSAALYAPLSRFAPAQALVLFKLQHTLATAAALVLLFRLHVRTGRLSFGDSRVFAAVFALAVSVYQPFWEVYHLGGQSTGAVFLVLVFGTRCYTRGHEFLAAVCFALAAAVKPGFVVPLVVLSGLSGAHFAGYAAGIGLLLGLASIAFAGWPVHVAFLERMLATRPEPWLFNSSLTVFLDNLQTMRGSPIGAVTASLASTTIRLGVAGILIACLARAGLTVTSDAGRRHLRIVIAITSGLLVLPIVWEHYLALLFIPISYCLAVCPRLPRRARGLLTAIVVMSMAQDVSVIDRIRSLIYLNTWPELVAAGLFKSAPLALTAILLMAHRRELATMSCDM